MCSKMSCASGLWLQSQRCLSCFNMGPLSREAGRQSWEYERLQAPGCCAALLSWVRQSVQLPGAGLGRRLRRERWT